MNCTCWVSQMKPMEWLGVPESARKEHEAPCPLATPQRVKITEVFVVETERAEGMLAALLQTAAEHGATFLSGTTEQLR